jgi:two-component system NtrC family sensor kinase
MDDNKSLASIRLNGKEPSGRVATTAADATALGRADRLANVGQLAAGLAHEMNTPLGSISAHAEESLQLLEHLPDGRLSRERLEDLRGRLLAIMRQAHRCSRVATRLLQFAQPGRPVGGKCIPNEVLRGVVELFTPAASEKGVHLDRLAEANLPDAPVGPAELEQLLMNLIQNAIDACQRGDIVRVQAVGADRHIQFIVTDTGCGIPHETLNRIFDPFFTTKSVGHGTGLGLSVCHGIVRSVGGSIEVESAPGQGTRVTVSLPTDADTRAGVRVHEACPIVAGAFAPPARKESGGKS